MLLSATSGAVAVAPLPTTLAEAFVLVSWWKPLIVIAPFLAWAWFVTSVLDKHAARFFLPRATWNMVHMLVGVGALVAALAIPLENTFTFLISLGVAVLILGVDIGVFIALANRDDRVPEKHRIRMSLDSWREARASKAAKKQAGAVTLQITGPDKSLVRAPDVGTPEFEVRTAAESVFIGATKARASQVDIAPSGKEGTYGVSMLVDGLRQSGEAMPAAGAVKVIDFWKAAAKMDVADRRRKQTGDVTVGEGAVARKIRMTAIGAAGGMRLSMLFDPDTAVRRKYDELGLFDTQKDEIQKIIDDQKGVVLLAAPPDQGLTTLLYAIMRRHDAYTTNVQTIELEVQDSLEGIRQNVFDPKGEGPEFSTLVRSILRRDPNVVGIAELPDTQTAQEIVKADLDRTRVFVCVRADGAAGAVQAWVKAVGDPEKAAAALHGVIALRLLRRLCTNCRVAYQPAPDMLKKLNLPADKIKQLYKKGGQVLIKNKPEVCPTCNGGGYFGQDGVFEAALIGPAERELVKTGNLTGLRGEWRKRGVLSVQQSALRKAVEGVTSVEEVTRITAPPASPTAPGAQGQVTPKPAGAPAAVKTTPGAKPPASPAR